MVFLIGGQYISNIVVIVEAVAVTVVVVALSQSHYINMCHTISVSLYKHSTIALY